MGFKVAIVDYQENLSAIRKVREVVFINEQGVPAELEWDTIDPKCVHALAWDDAGGVIGTGRLTPDDLIGRMAVLSSWRSRGVGSAILKELVTAAHRQGRTKLALNAQVHAVAFYERHGFKVVGEEFFEAGIAHRRMVSEGG